MPVPSTSLSATPRPRGGGASGPAPPCLAGLYLDAALGYCVSCPSPYVESLAGSEGIQSCYYFDIVDNQAIQGNNAVEYRSGSFTITIPLCKERCASRATCKSFDYKDGNAECMISDTNCATAGSACKSYDDFTYYEIHRYTSTDTSWRLVRYRPPAASASAWTWHNINDDLAGTSTYGDPTDSTNAWSVPFGTFTHYMLGACDMSLWVEITKADYDGESQSSSYIRWTYSATSCASPQTSACDIANAGQTCDGANRKTGSSIDPMFAVTCNADDNFWDYVVYVEDSYTNWNSAVWETGACVWVK